MVKRLQAGIVEQSQSFLLSLLILSALGVSLFVARAVTSDSIRYWFLLWNLVLAWLPLLFAFWLHENLKKRPWSHWSNLLLTFLWLGFLPNSFYIITDLIHLHDSGEVSVLFDAVMMMTFIMAGLLNGFTSLLVVHHNLLKRLRAWRAHAIIGVVLLLTSFAIYLGRSLRWNTWDILVNPFGILFDLSERVVRPSSSNELVEVMLLFFMLLSALYFAIWHTFLFIRNTNK